jgi:TolB-like protein/class 3 adenylate cyclase
MSGGHEPDAELEIGHVLFLDIVGFSKLLLDEQTEYSHRLNQIARNTEQFRRAEAADKLIRLPTGDGMVLVFFTSPEAPVRCAIEIATALKSSSSLGLRMGIHSGPVNKIVDVNDRANLAGSGINIAQRVMDCGDAGHILLSKHVAEDLQQRSKWQSQLTDLGECEVKHGVRVNLVNLCTAEAGNAAIPAKIASAKQQQADAARVGTLAVKPLDNYSGDASKDYFADGMTDELITKLSQISALKKVISRSTMMKYKRSPKSASEIARELDVAVLVEGSVVVSGDQARISVQLIEAATDQNLWAESYTRSLANIITLQNEVALAIANAIEIKLTPVEKERLVAKRLVNPEAYDYYLRGKGAYGASKEDSDKKIDMLEKSISLDDTFAEAYAELSIAYSSKAYFLEGSARELEQKAEEALATALQLSPDLPVALMARARLLWRPTTGFQHEETIAEVRRALALAPNLADAHFFLGAIYLHVGLMHEATQHCKRADELGPGNGATRFQFSVIALWQGRYQEVEDVATASIGGWVRAFIEHNVALALFYRGRIGEAKARIDSAKREFKDEGGIMASVQALLHAADGDRAKAEAKIAEAIEIGQGFGHYHHTTQIFASAYAILGDVDSAMKWLVYTAENGFPNLTWFERDPTFENLRTEPRFIEFLDKLRPRFERFKALAQPPI